MVLFTVITATWNRSRMILPTLHAVQRQSCTDYEHLVVGDACTDDTGAVVAALGDPRLRFLSTERRCFSQAGPNNLGLAEARGRFIAYLGHDDIWHPDHLKNLARVLTSRAGPDFAVAGCIYFGAPTAGLDLATTCGKAGKLEGPAFFVPSALAHRREVADKIGPWTMPGASDRLVDVDFQARAFAAGLRFAATGQVSVFKFTAGARYLSYLEPRVQEQEAMLELLGGPDYGSWLTATLDRLGRAGRIHASQPIHGDGLAKGEAARRTRVMKGIEPPRLRRLRLVAQVRHAEGWHAHDWHGDAPDRHGFLDSGPSREPAFLLPVTSGRPVILDLPLRHKDPAVPEDLRFLVNGRACAARPGRVWGPVGHWRVEAQLYPDRPSVLRIIQPEAAMLGAERRGVALGPVTVLRRDPAALIVPLRHAALALGDVAGDLALVLHALQGVVSGRKNP